MKKIQLLHGKTALVDAEDFERISVFHWYAHFQRGRWYVVRTVGRKKRRYLHCEILGQRGIDHKNGDGLDNRRKNLRLASQQQNLRGFRRKIPGTSSQFRGVCWHKKAGKWMSHITLDYKFKYLGLFERETDAARAYDEAARRYFGEFASPNFGGVR